MKKIYGLMLIPVLALSGCVSKITKEEGVKRADEILKKKVDLSDTKALRFEADMSMLGDLKQAGKKNYSKVSTSGVMEFSKEKSYFHKLEKDESASETSSSKSNEKSEVETWGYVKDDVFITAVRTVNDGKETKKYTEVKSSAVSAFKAALKGIVGSATAELEAGSKELLETVKGLLSATEEELKKQGENYTVQAYSGGEGSLVVKASGELNQYEGIAGTGSASSKYVWDNYILSEVAVEMKGTANDKENKTEGKFEMTMNQKVQFRCRVSYPNLSGYKKA